MTWFWSIILIWLIFPAAAAGCPDGRFGQLESLTYTDNEDIPSTLVQEFVRVYRTGVYGSTSLPAQEGMVLCNGDLLETWHDMEVMLHPRGRTHASLIEGGSLVRLDEQPKILRGYVTFFFNDEALSELRSGWTAWVGPIAHSTPHSEFRIGARQPNNSGDGCSWISEVTVFGKEGDGHSLSVVPSSEWEPIVVEGGQSMTISSRDGKKKLPKNVTAENLLSIDILRERYSKEILSILSAPNSDQSSREHACRTGDALEKIGRSLEPKE